MKQSVSNSLSEKYQKLEVTTENQVEKTEINERITLNAMGTKVVISLDKLKIFEKTSRLGKLYRFRSLNQEELTKICDDYDLKTNEFFFDRDASVLRTILNYAITGEVHLNSDICEVFIEKEFEYWIIDWKRVKRCCKTRYEENLEKKTNSIEAEAEILNDLKLNKLNFINPGLTLKLWNLFEYPKNSLSGTVSDCF